MKELDSCMVQAKVDELEKQILEARNRHALRLHEEKDTETQAIFLNGEHSSLTSSQIGELRDLHAKELANSTEQAEDAAKGYKETIPK